MHFQVIVHVQFDTPLTMEDEDGDMLVPGYVVTLGVNGVDAADAGGPATQAALRAYGKEDTSSGHHARHVAEVKVGEVSLADWPRETVERFTGDPKQRGVYFTSGLAFYTDD